MLDKFKIGILERALERTIDTMRSSKFVGDDDRHLAKCEALRDELAEMKAEP